MATIATRYESEGFDVAIDHCRLPQNIDAWLERPGLQAIKIAVLPPLDVVLQRNRTRTNKDFDPAALVPVIEGVYAGYQQHTLDGWLVCDNLESVDQVLMKLTPS